MEERRRIARDLHDSVSQALFSTVLHTRTAQKALEQDDATPPGRIAQSLSAIAELTKSVQGEMRALIFELRRDPIHDGLVSALSRHAAGLRAADGPTIRGEGLEFAASALPGRRDPALRHRARGVGQCRQACPRHRCVRPGGGSEWARTRRGPRQRRGVRPERRTSRPLRLGLDAKPCNRDRRASHDHQQAWVRDPRPGPRPGGDGRGRDGPAQCRREHRRPDRRRSRGRTPGVARIPRQRTRHRGPRPSGRRRSGARAARVHGVGRHFRTWW